MEKFFKWFETYRKPIGYTVGGLNVFNGLTNLLFGDLLGAVFWFLLGGAIILDAKYFK